MHLNSMAYSVWMQIVQRELPLLVRSRLPALPTHPALPTRPPLPDLQSRDAVGEDVPDGPYHGVVLRRRRADGSELKTL